MRASEGINSPNTGDRKLKNRKCSSWGGRLDGRCSVYIGRANPEQDSRGSCANGGSLPVDRNKLGPDRGVKRREFFIFCGHAHGI